MDEVVHGEGMLVVYVDLCLRDWLIYTSPINDVSDPVRLK